MIPVEIINAFLIKIHILNINKSSKRNRQKKRKKKRKRIVKYSDYYYSNVIIKLYILIYHKLGLY